MSQDGIAHGGEDKRTVVLHTASQSFLLSSWTRHTGCDGGWPDARLPRPADTPKLQANSNWVALYLNGHYVQCAHASFMHMGMRTVRHTRDKIFMVTAHRALIGGGGGGTAPTTTRSTAPNGAAHGKAQAHTKWQMYKLQMDSLVWSSSQEASKCAARVVKQQQMSTVHRDATVPLLIKHRTLCWLRSVFTDAPTREDVLATARETGSVWLQNKREPSTDRFLLLFFKTSTTHLKAQFTDFHNLLFSSSTSTQLATLNSRYCVVWNFMQRDLKKKKH